MKMINCLAEVTNFPDPTKLVDFLKYGQLGAALAMLILGFYLHWQASHATSEIPERKNVARQFMNYAIAFFTLCMIGEGMHSFIPKPDRSVTATLFVPPIDESNAGEYGNIEIVSNYGKSREKRKALGEGQTFEVHEGSTFQISLYAVTKKLSDLTLTKQSLENNLAKAHSDLGAGEPK